jgi:hypothetical protein
LAGISASVARARSNQPPVAAFDQWVRARLVRQRRISQWNDHLAAMSRFHARTDQQGVASVQDTICEYATGDQEFLLVEASSDGGVVVRVSSLGGGFASIDLPVDQLADLGRKLLTRAAAFA